MQCEQIRPNVRKFLDDLLDEKDYQSTYRHLAGCERCSGYASSVGTLSWRLHELGQAPLPPDMTSTVLYEMKSKLKKAAQAVTIPAEAVQQSGGAGSATRALWIAVIVLGAVSIGATSAAFFWRSSRGPAAFSIASIGPSTPSVPGFVPERLAEWHVHYSQEARQELSDLIIDMQLAVERESDRSIVFLVSTEKAEEFRERIAAGTGFVNEFGAASLDGKFGARTTVYFEE